MSVRTSALSLARLLWWYGEDDLWPRALQLQPSAVADLGPEFARLASDRSAVERVWAKAPTDAALLLPTIQLLTGETRAAVRRRRRPTKDMPVALAIDMEGLWGDPGLAEVSRILDEREMFGRSS